MQVNKHHSAAALEDLMQYYVFLMFIFQSRLLLSNIMWEIIDYIFEGVSTDQPSTLCLMLPFTLFKKKKKIHSVLQSPSWTLSVRLCVYMGVCERKQIKMKSQSIITTDIFFLWSKEFCSKTTWKSIQLTQKWLQNWSCYL